MGKNRLFIPQDTMDRWVDEERAVLTDDELTLINEARIYRLAPAVLFLREATGADDPLELVGRVKDQAQLTILGADAYMDSVILDENAYDVRRGFVAIPSIAPSHPDTIPPPPEKRAATPVAIAVESDIGEGFPVLVHEGTSDDVIDEEGPTVFATDAEPAATPPMLPATQPTPATPEAATVASEPARDDDDGDDELARLLLKSLK